MEFDIPKEVQNDQHWKNKSLNQVRGFILTKAIHIEKFIGRVLLQILFDKKKERENYYNRELKNAVFSQRIKKLELVLLSKGEKKSWEKLEDPLYQLKKIRNRVAHDNWYMVSEKKVELEGIEITGKNLAKVGDQYLKAHYYLHTLFDKYDGFEEMKEKIENKNP